MSAIYYETLVANLHAILVACAVYLMHKYKMFVTGPTTTTKKEDENSKKEDENNTKKDEDTKRKESSCPKITAGEGIRVTLDESEKECEIALADAPFDVARNTLGTAGRGLSIVPDETEQRLNLGLELRGGENVKIAEDESDEKALRIDVTVPKFTVGENMSLEELEPNSFKISSLHKQLKGRDIIEVGEGLSLEESEENPEKLALSLDMEFLQDSISKTVKRIIRESLGSTGAFEETTGEDGEVAMKLSPEFVKKSDLKGMLGEMGIKQVSGKGLLKTVQDAEDPDVQNLSLDEETLNEFLAKYMNSKGIKKIGGKGLLKMLEDAEDPDSSTLSLDDETLNEALAKYLKDKGIKKVEGKGLLKMSQDEQDPDSYHLSFDDETLNGAMEKYLSEKGIHGLGAGDGLVLKEGDGGADEEGVSKPVLALDAGYVQEKIVDIMNAKNFRAVNVGQGLRYSVVDDVITISIDLYAELKKILCKGYFVNVVAHERTKRIVVRYDNASRDVDLGSLKKHEYGLTLKEN